MDIRCPSCATLYEFDESRIGGEGINVRCSACGQVFKVRATAPEDEVAWMVRRKNGGEVIHFEDLQTLQRWIIESRVSRDDNISKTGETWKPLGDIGELATFFQVVDEVSVPRDQLFSRTDGYLTAAAREINSNDEASVGGERSEQTPAASHLAETAAAALAAMTGDADVVPDDDELDLAARAVITSEHEAAADELEEAAQRGFEESADLPRVTSGAAMIPEEIAADELVDDPSGAVENTYASDDPMLRRRVSAESDAFAAITSGPHPITTAAKPSRDSISVRSADDPNRNERRANAKTAALGASAAVALAAHRAGESGSAEAASDAPNPPSPPRRGRRAAGPLLTTVSATTVGTTEYEEPPKEFDDAPLLAPRAETSAAIAALEEDEKRSPLLWALLLVAMILFLFWWAFSPRSGDDDPLNTEPIALAPDATLVSADTTARVPAPTFDEGSGAAAADDGSGTIAGNTEPVPPTIPPRPGSLADAAAAAVAAADAGPSNNAQNSEAADMLARAEAQAREEREEREAEAARERERAEARAERERAQRDRSARAEREQPGREQSEREPREREERATPPTPRRPTSYDGLMDAANDALQSGDLDDALLLFADAVEARPSSAEAHVGMARTYERQGQLDTASVRYQRATRVNGRYTPAWLGLANARRRAGDRDAAIEAYQRVLSIVRTGSSADRAREALGEMGVDVE